MKTIEKILNAFLTVFNKINPDYTSISSITLINLTNAKEEESKKDNNVTIIQKAQNIVNKALKNFSKLNLALSNKKIMIRFCIRQFRTMAPIKEKTIRQ